MAPAPTTTATEPQAKKSKTGEGYLKNIRCVKNSTGFWLCLFCACVIQFPVSWFDITRAATPQGSKRDVQEVSGKANAPAAKVLWGEQNKAAKL